MMKCTCGEPLLRWVHNSPPKPCGGVRSIREVATRLGLPVVESPDSDAIIDSMTGKRQSE